MPDRSLRLLTLPPQSPQGGERIGVLLRERPASPPDTTGTTGTPSGGGTGDDGRDGGSSHGEQGEGGSGGGRTPQDDRREGRERGGERGDNPFAPPPEGMPDRPWQPRRPAGGEGADGGRPDQDAGGGSPWGNQWSDRQPGRSPGGFGDRPGAPSNGPEGPGNSGSGTNMRWDPTDPAQRRARYSLLSGMWAFFFVLFGWPSAALLLGALAMYWSISALRAKPRTPDPDAPAPAQTARPQTTAAVSGLVTASLAIALVAAGFTAKLVYSDYYTCANDAPTNQARQSCTDLLPKDLRGLLGTGS
ncbi:hypothetical protein [Streptomyces cellulosae]|uniref:hypothetical protein n=1 Tax=Streptomyces cellulosae TaxID=1968 RepID=UPI0004C76377|nr:hypothetical protein [Streptomyces cellulosae]